MTRYAILNLSFFYQIEWQFFVLKKTYRVIHLVVDWVELT